MHVCVCACGVRVVRVRVVRVVCVRVRARVRATRAHLVGDLRLKPRLKHCIMSDSPSSHSGPPPKMEEPERVESNEKMVEVAARWYAVGVMLGLGERPRRSSMAEKSMSLACGSCRGGGGGGGGVGGVGVGVGVGVGCAPKGWALPPESELESDGWHAMPVRVGKVSGS